LAPVAAVRRGCRERRVRGSVKLGAARIMVLGETPKMAA